MDPNSLVAELELSAIASIPEIRERGLILDELYNPTSEQHREWFVFVCDRLEEYSHNMIMKNRSTDDADVPFDRRPLKGTTPEKKLTSFWRRINAPDANLGNASVGPSPQSISLGAATQVLGEMGLDRNSVFCELGSAHGQVCFVAKLLFGVFRAYGYELDPIRERWSELARDELFHLSSAEVQFRRQDITRLDALPADVTHVYMFDKDFPPAVSDHVFSLLFRARRTLQVFATSKPEKRRPTEGDAAQWLRQQELIARVPARLSVSGETHSFYVFRV